MIIFLQRRWGVVRGVRRVGIRSPGRSGRRRGAWGMGEIATLVSLDNLPIICTMYHVRKVRRVNLLGLRECEWR